MSNIGDLGADVTISLNLQDNASTQLDSSTKNINRRWKEMRDQQRAVGREFEINHRTFTQTARALQTIGNIANRVINVYQAYTLSQIRINDLQRESRDLSRDLAEALASGNIEKATRIQEDIKKNTEETNRALFDQILLYVTMGLVAASAASNISKKLLPALAKIRGSSTVKPSNIPQGGGGNVPKGSKLGGKGKFSLGGGGKAGLGALGLIGGGLAENIINSDDPVQAIIDFFTKTSIAPDTKIIIKVNVNGTEQEQVIDLKNPYVVG